MKKGKAYQIAYLAVQVFLAFIYLIQIPVVLQSKVGPLILIDYGLALIEITGGIYAIVNFFKKEQIKYLTIASYLPLLILIERGIIAILGAALIALATVAKYQLLKEEKV